MKIEEFNKEMNENLKELDIELSEKQLKQFYDYMNILIVLKIKKKIKI